MEGIKKGGPEESYLSEGRGVHGFSKEGGKRTLRLESRRERWIEEVERVN